MSVPQWAVFTVNCIFVFLAESASVRLPDMGTVQTNKGSDRQPIVKTVRLGLSKI